MKRKTTFFAAITVLAAMAWTTAAAQTATSKEKLDSMNRYQWNKENNRYEKTQKEIYAYRPDGKMLKREKINSFSDYNGDGVIDLKDTNITQEDYHYASDGKLTEITMSTSRSEEPLRVREKYTVTHYPDGKVQRYTHIDKHPTREEWKASGEYREIEYNAAGKPTLVNTFRSGEGVSVPVDDYPSYGTMRLMRYKYTYNAQQLTEKVEVLLQLPDNSWTTYGSFTLNYNAQNQPAFIIMEMGPMRVRWSYAISTDNTRINTSAEKWNNETNTWEKTEDGNVIKLDPNKSWADLIYPYDALSPYSDSGMGVDVYTLIPYKQLEEEGVHTDPEGNLYKTKEVYYYSPFSGTSVPAVRAEQSLTLYPNPAADYFTVQGLTAPAQVSLYDLSGKQVLQTTAQPDVAVSVSDIPRGVYMVKINGVPAASKLVLR